MAPRSTATLRPEVSPFRRGLKSTDLRALFEMTPSPICIATTDGTLLRGNPALLALGYSREELEGTQLEELFHPEDRERLRRGLDRLASDGGDVIGFEARHRLPGGSWRWFSWTATAAPEEGRIYAVGRDVTEEVRLRRSLGETATRLSALIEAAQAGVVVEDDRCRLTLLNPAFREMFDVRQSDDEIVGRPTREALSGVLRFVDDRGAFLERIDLLVAERRRVLSEELFLTDGRILERDYLPISTEAGYRGHLWVFRDITEHRLARAELEATVRELRAKNRELHRLRRSLREQALRDPLTGLYNRRYLEQRFESELLRADRSESPLSLLVLDLDRFKSVNDRFGHAVGDRVLEATGRFLTARLRTGDLAVRQGGEEFVVLLPDTPLEAAVSVAEAVRTKLADVAESVEGLEGIRVTTSVGVATFPVHGRQPEELLAAADAALYKAKDEGRDRVVVAEPFDSASGRRPASRRRAL